MRRTLLAGAIAAVTVGVLTLTAQSAQAATICNGCNYLEPATYLGAHNAATSDLSTFQHILSDTDNAPFTDYWVFDITPSSMGSASADFTFTTGITGFAGALYEDNGTACAGGPGTACGAPQLGALIGSDAAGGGSDRQWEIIFSLDPGRYIIVASGTTQTNSAYTGQVSFLPQEAPEPISLALFGIGLGAVALKARRRRT